MELPQEFALYFEGLIESGTYGSTPEQINLTLLRVLFGTFRDVKRSAVRGLLVKGVEEGKIVRNLVGSGEDTEHAIKHVLKDWNDEIKKTREEREERKEKKEGE